MGQIPIQCCQQEDLEGRGSSEFKLDDKRFPEEIPELAQIRELGYDGRAVPAQHWGCCKGKDDPPDKTKPGASMIESLNYIPVRFDESPTVDVERSQARYSTIVVHSSRARTQRRSKAWDDWLRAAAAGRNIMLLSGVHATPDHEAGDESVRICNKIPAMYYLDRGLTKLSVFPIEAKENTDSGVITVLVDNIQVICPAIDCMSSFDYVEQQLDESERERAVFLQYSAEDAKGRRLCFLEESEHAMDRFVQALTALWLEKRNDHSMWF